LSRSPSSVTLERLELPLFGALAAAASALACLLAYEVSIALPLALGGAVVVAALALVRPLWALAAGIGLLPLELASLKLGAVGLSASEATFALTAVMWVVGRLARGEVPASTSPLGKPLTAMVAAIVPGLAIAQSSFPVAKVLVMWVVFLVIYEIVVTEARDDSVRGLLLVLAVAGAVVGAIAAVTSGGVEQAATGFGDEVSGRAFGSFGSPNTLATFEALALPGALALGLGGRAAVRPVALGAFALTLAGLALSLSRGGLLAVAGALALMLVWGPFRLVVAAATVVVAILAFAGANPLGEVQQVDTVTQRLSSVGYSAGGVDPRFNIWRTTPQIIADHPVFGVGANEFPLVGPEYGLTGRMEPYEHAHNIPLTVAAETGLLGLAAFTWAAIVLVGVLIRAYRRTDGVDRGVAVALAAAFSALVLQGIVDYTLRSNAIVAIVFVLAGCAVVTARGGGPPPRRVARHDELQPAGRAARPEPSASARESNDSVPPSITGAARPGTTGAWPQPS